MFFDDIVDNAFGGVSEINLRVREVVNPPSFFQSSPSKTPSSNGNVLVRLLQIKEEDIGIIIHGGIFGKTGLHASFSLSCLKVLAESNRM